ncbi:MAG TPA: hypothetical protein VMW76_04295 [Bacteroidales bacterium]|nr:hypothetical protein [Bacteroidales bacterium]
MDNIQFSGYVNPYIYILFIILLPFEIPAWLLLILSFLSGLIVDLFTGIPGLHASATLFAGFVRPYILAVIAPREGYEQGESPGLKRYGFRWFLLYIAVIILVHHIALFYLEVFSITYFFRTLARVLLSSIFSITFILLIQTLIIRR